MLRWQRCPEKPAKDTYFQLDPPRGTTKTVSENLVKISITIYKNMM